MVEVVTGLMMMLEQGALPRVISLVLTTPTSMVKVLLPLVMEAPLGKMPRMP